MTDAAGADRLLSIRDLVLRIGWTRQHVARDERAGRFPRRIRIGPNSVRWSEAEITAWADAKKAERLRSGEGA